MQGVLHFGEVAQLRRDGARQLVGVEVQVGLEQRELPQLRRDRPREAAAQRTPQTRFVLFV